MPNSEIPDCRQIVNTYADMLYRIVYHYTGNSEDTEDIVQDVFLTWIDKRPIFNTVEHEKAWFIRVAINKATNWYRSARIRYTVSISEKMKNPTEDDFTVQSDRRTDILEQIRTMPAKYKAVIYLHFYEGYTIREMSKILKLNEHTVQTRFHRAKKILYKKMKGDLHHEDSLST